MKPDAIRPIIICGSSASGKTTTAKLVANLLDLPPEARPSAGALFRRIADDQKMTLAELRTLAVEDPSIDIMIDRRILAPARRKEACVLDGRVLAWLAHQEKIDAIKVLLTVSQDEAIARVAKRDRLTLEEARFHIRKRDREDAERLGRLYGWVPSEESYYDMIFYSDAYEPSVIAKWIVNGTK